MMNVFRFINFVRLRILMYWKGYPTSLDHTVKSENQ